MLPNHITDLFLMHFLLLKSCLLYFLNVSIVKVMVSVIESSGHSEEYKRKSNISLSSFPTTDPTVKVCASFQRCTYVICKCTYIMFNNQWHLLDPLFSGLPPCASAEVPEEIQRLLGDGASITW